MTHNTFILRDLIATSQCTVSVAYVINPQLTYDNPNLRHDFDMLESNVNRALPEQNHIPHTGPVGLNIDFRR